MIKLTAQHYEGIVVPKRREWPKYATQIMNIANQNCKGTSPANVGSCKDAWLQMRQQGIPGTLENWTQFYDQTYGRERLVVAGKKIHAMLIKMRIDWITEDMCIDYAMEIAYNKTHMGLGGEEMAIQVVARYFGMDYRFSTPQEESQGIDGWIGGRPVQVKKHDGVVKGHVHNHADASRTLVITYEEKRKNCYILNPEFMHN